LEEAIRIALDQSQSEVRFDREMIVNAGLSDAHIAGQIGIGKSIEAAAAGCHFGAIKQVSSSIHDNLPSDR